MIWGKLWQRFMPYIFNVSLIANLYSQLPEMQICNPFQDSNSRDCLLWVSVAHNKVQLLSLTYLSVSIVRWLHNSEKNAPLPWVPLASTPAHRHARTQTQKWSEYPTRNQLHPQAALLLNTTMDLFYLVKHKQKPQQDSSWNIICVWSMFMDNNCGNA